MTSAASGTGVNSTAGVWLLVIAISTLARSLESSGTSYFPGATSIISVDSVAKGIALLTTSKRVSAFCPVPPQAEHPILISPCSYSM